jgi:hypothetical protein
MPKLKDMTYESPTLKWVFDNVGETPSKDDLGRTAVALMEADARLSNVIIDAERLIADTIANREHIRTGLAKINTELNG